MLGALAATPIFEARADTPPAFSIARSSASMRTPFYHERDFATNTNVMQVAGQITVVKTIGERIKWARERVGLTQKQRADKAGVSQGTIGNLESGLRERPRELLNIAGALELSPVWVETGKGPWSNAPMSNVAPASLGTVRVPLISSIQAGMWSEIVDTFQPGDAEEWLTTDLELSSSAFALQIKGDSMLPEFRPGDRVIIDPDVAPQPGDFVAAKNGGEEATFKKYRPRGMDAAGNVIFELVPLNEDYETLRSDTQPIRIVGTMVEHRKYRKPR